MARTDNLTDFLNDVATAIKSKLDDNTSIPASQFDTKIMEIETGGNYETRTINITANGSQTVTPNQGYDAIESLTLNVSVPIKQLQDKSYEFTQNTNIVLRPETGYDGFSSVNLQINVPGQQINNQNKTVTPTTSQQVISADQGYTGLGDVTVNAVTSSIDQNIVAGNIKDGVSILGVTGNYTGSGDPEYAQNLLLSQQILGSPLPYIPLEYIESTGTQYIDTGIKPYITQFESEFALTTVSPSTNGYVAGVYNAGNRYYTVSLDLIGNTFRSADKSNTTIMLGNSDTNKHHIIYNNYNNKVIFDGVEKGTVTNLPSISEDNLYLFALHGNQQEGSTQYLVGRIYYVKIIDKTTSTLVANFIPVKRRSDDEICLYDKVTNTFFTNQGTGSFIAGPEIS